MTTFIRLFLPDCHPHRPFEARLQPGQQFSLHGGDATAHQSGRGPLLQPGCVQVYRRWAKGILRRAISPLSGVFSRFERCCFLLVCSSSDHGRYLLIGILPLSSLSPFIGHLTPNDTHFMLKKDSLLVCLSFLFYRCGNFILEPWCDLPHAQPLLQNPASSTLFFFEQRSLRQDSEGNGSLRIQVSLFFLLVDYGIAMRSPHCFALNSPKVPLRLHFIREL